MTNYFTENVFMLFKYLFVSWMKPLTDFRPFSCLVLRRGLGYIVGTFASVVLFEILSEYRTVFNRL